MRVKPPFHPLILIFDPHCDPPFLLKRVLKRVIFPPMTRFFRLGNRPKRATGCRSNLRSLRFLL